MGLSAVANDMGYVGAAGWEGCCSKVGGWFRVEEVDFQHNYRSNNDNVVILSVANIQNYSACSLKVNCWASSRDRIHQIPCSSPHPIPRNKRDIVFI